MRIRKLAAFLLLFCSCALFFPAAALAEEEGYNTLDRNMTTEHYNVEVALSEGNVYHIEEEVTVNFYTSRHGIYRYIPYRGTIQYLDAAGQVRQKNYRARIQNVRVQGAPFETSYENGNVVIQIGDADRYVSGRQTYRISFDFDAMDDGIPEFDQIYINLIPTGWRTEIDQARFSLTLPKAIPEEAVALYGGAYGSENSLDATYTIEGNTIHGSVNHLEAFEGLTLRAQVEEGYFSGESTYAFQQFLIWILIGIIPLGVAVLYLCFGRDRPILQMVTVTPPRGMTSAEVGYIMDAMIDNRDLLSLIVYWADQGYLSITEAGEDDFILTRLADLPETAKKYEQTLFRGLFASGDSVAVSSLKEKFYSKLQLAKTQLQSQFSASKGTSLHTTASRVCQCVALVLSVAVSLVGTVWQAYIDIAPVGLSIGFTFGNVLLFFLAIAAYVVRETRYVRSRAAFRASVIAVTVLIGLVDAAMIWASLRWLPGYFTAILGLAASAVCLLLGCAMPQRTKQCREWLSELLGLREFIELAEKDRIEMFAREDPSYFYNILPFAYVMGVSDVWCKKFEGLAVPPPSWYYGGSAYSGNLFNTMLFMHSFQHCMNTVQANLAIPPAPKGGSGGGGFSGGGFSGGGFSGGGGGSW